MGTTIVTAKTNQSARVGLRGRRSVSRMALNAGAVVLAAASVSACGSSSSGVGSPAKPASKSSGGHPANRGGTNGATATKTAPDGLVIARIMANTNLTDVSGTRVTAVQDNGGISQSSGEGFVSVAKTETHNAKLTLWLYSYASSQDATQRYAQVSPRSTPAPTVLAGVGDKALASTTSVVVLKGAQVLQINVFASDALEMPLAAAKEQGIAPTQAAVDASLHLPQADASALAKAIAATMTGATATGNLRYLPKDAIDPCGLDPTKLNHGDITVTNTPAISETNGTSDCIYAFTGSRRGEPGTGSLRVSTMTVEQGAAAIPATSPRAEFNAAPRTFGNGPKGPQFWSATSGRISAVAGLFGEERFAMLVAPPGGVAGAASFGAPKIDMVATQPNPKKGYFADIADERSTRFVSYPECKEMYEMMIPFFVGYDPGRDNYTRADIDDLVAKIRDWCDKFTSNENPTGR